MDDDDDDDDDDNDDDDNNDTFTLSLERHSSVLTASDLSLRTSVFVSYPLRFVEF